MGKEYRFKLPFKCPITPLHAISLMFLYFKNKRKFNPLALAVSTTFIDFEPPYYLLIGEPLDHRIWHGFALAMRVYPILVTMGVYFIERLPCVIYPLAYGNSFSFYIGKLQ